MLTRRDVTVAFVSVVTAWCGLSLAAPQSAPGPAVLGPAVFTWDDMSVSPTDVGEYRQVIRQPTATLDELELHVTTLRPGHDSHPPHRHVNEELVIVREGTVEVLSGGEWQRLGPGSVVFNAANSLHALKSVGDRPAVYHVINWTTPATTALAARLAAGEEG